MTVRFAALWAAPAILWLAASSVGAQGLTGSGGQLEIFADEGIEWLRDQRKYVARGNAMARQDDTQVSGDTLTAFYRESGEGGDDGTEAAAGAIYRIVVDGDVVIASPDQTAYADRAVYFVDEKVAVLRGDDLRLVTPEQTVTARDSLEYWEDYNGTPIAVARGDAVVITPERRLEAEELVATMQPDESGQNRIVQIDAYGGVEIVGEGEYARGERGVYYVTEEIAVLAGDVRITQGETQLSGQRAEVNLASGVSRLLPTAGGRVSGLLAPGGAEGDGGGTPLDELRRGMGGADGGVDGGADGGADGGETGQAPGDSGPASAPQEDANQ